jgi:hypothetical protein
MAVCQVSHALKVASRSNFFQLQRKACGFLRSMRIVMLKTKRAVIVNSSANKLRYIIQQYSEVCTAKFVE